jgi:hypothetical protein
MVGKNDKNKINNSKNNNNNDDSSSSMMIDSGGPIAGAGSPATSNQIVNTAISNSSTNSHNSELEVALEAMWKKSMLEIQTFDPYSTYSIHYIMSQMIIALFVLTFNHI